MITNFGESHFWLQPFTFIFLLISVQSKFYVLLSNWTTTRLLTGGGARLSAGWESHLSVSPKLCLCLFYLTSEERKSQDFGQQQLWWIHVDISLCLNLHFPDDQWTWTNVYVPLTFLLSGMSSLCPLVFVVFFFFSPSELFIFFLLFCKMLIFRDLS